MQIIKLFFIIITGAALLGGCGGGAAAVELMPLSQAAKDNNVAEAKLLIANGADVNAKKEDGWTPLHWAADTNAAEVAKLLIAKGAEVNAKGNYGLTPLHWAAGNNAAEIAKLLIDNGAEVNAKDNGGYTPLYRAARHNAAEVAKLLIANGAAEAESQAVNGHWLGADVGTYRVRRPSSQSLTPSLEEWNPEAARQAAAEQARRKAEAKSDSQTFGLLVGLGAGFAAGRKVLKDSGDATRAAEAGKQVMESVHKITGITSGDESGNRGNVRDDVCDPTDVEKVEAARLNRAKPSGGVAHSCCYSALLAEFLRKVNKRCNRIPEMNTNRQQRDEALGCVAKTASSGLSPTLSGCRTALRL